MRAVALHCAAAVIGALWRARQSGLVTTYGFAGWASEHEVRAAGLFGNRGVLLGRLDRNYSRHEGPEHVMAFADAERQGR